MNKARSNILTILFLALIGCLIYAISAGIRANYGILLNAIVENSGVPYASVSFVLAVGQLVFGLTQPVFGIVAIKKSNSFVLFLGALLVAAGLLMLPLCKSFWLLLLFLGILLPAGTGALSFGIVMGAITPALGERKAATVAGLVSASSGLGNIVLSPLIQGLLTSNGLWGAMIFLSAPALAILPISLLLSKSTAKNEGAAEQAALKNTSLGALFSEALRNKSYLFVLIGFFTCGFHMAIIETHLFSEITSYGFSEQTSAYAFSIYGITTMLGSVTSGLLGSRYKMKWVLGGLYAARVLMIAAFLLLPKTLLVNYAFISLLGFTGSSTVPPTSGLINHIFGAAKLAVLLGFAFIAHQTGSFFSAWLGGLSIAATGRYELIWSASALLSILAALVTFRISEGSAHDQPGR
jgi:MFS family permease